MISVTPRFPVVTRTLLLIGAALGMGLLATSCASDPVPPSATTAPSATLSIPEKIHVEGIPPLSRDTTDQTAVYLRLGGASFKGWHSTDRAMLVTTRSGAAVQLHLVPEPLAKRQRLTSGNEPVTSGAVLNDTAGHTLLFSRDQGGDENFQLYRLDWRAKKTTRLTNDTSRNTNWKLSQDGQWIAYNSTRRNNRDNDVYIMRADGTGERRLLQADSPVWQVRDWTRDSTALLLSKPLTARHTTLHLLSVADGSLREITTPGEKIYYKNAVLAENDTAVYALSDADSDFLHLARIDLATGKRTPLLATPPTWDIESFDVSHDGKTLAYVLNEDGFSRLHLLDLATRQALPVPKLDGTLISDLSWHPKRRELGFTQSGAATQNDAWSLNVDSGELARWTTRKSGQEPAFVEPELVHVTSFDGLRISSLVYRPDPKKFPGPRPVIVSFHGGPEGQSRAGFLGRNNYYLNELGIGLVYPNVRGSLGYGRKFLHMDNALKREDAVKDAGAVFDWIKNDPGFDSRRIAVMGGSYGGFMTLATLIRYNDTLRCGVDVVGISNFVAFLKNTADYRRNQRRLEYGDERKPEVRAFLEKISPTNNADKIKAPLLIVQGKNDARVPASEAEAIRDAVRKNGGIAWYLVADNEGHGFKKRENIDYQFYATVAFFKKYLLEE